MQVTASIMFHTLTVKVCRKCCQANFSMITVLKKTKMPSLHIFKKMFFNFISYSKFRIHYLSLHVSSLCPVLFRSQRKLCRLSGVWDPDSQAHDAALRHPADEAQAPSSVWTQRDWKDISGPASGPLPPAAESDGLIWAKRAASQQYCHIQHASAVAEGNPHDWCFRETYDPPVILQKEHLTFVHVGVAVVSVKSGKPGRQREWSRATVGFDHRWHKWSSRHHWAC